ncbi:VWA domain-containing protein [Klebsiella oxytoca]|uniref:VWA domain-containing protein n=1 Tax=Klebsiella oxytoca TaxID=571 RepID=A0AAP2FLI4_KLEOX|nr:VWA domain-containing protein [Klebsiella oxytoca]MBQ0600807.1 VWA domain-containing protein [Klebsiella oxytoca]
MGIYNSLPIVARALSDQLNINVTVGGSDAYASVVNGKGSINIPFYKDAESISDAILGFTVHEAAHIRFTEFDLLTPALNALSGQPVEVRNDFGDLVSSGRYNKKVLHSLWNIAEDLRIERSIVRVFPGSLRYLQAVRDFVFDGDIESSDVPATIYLDTMLLCGRQRYHGFDTHAEIRRKEFISVFGQDLLDKSLDTLGLAVFADSTLDCLDVARQLYDLAIDAFKQEQEDKEDTSSPSLPDQENGCSGDSDDNSDSDDAPGSADGSDDRSDDSLVTDTEDASATSGGSDSQTDSPDDNAPDASGKSGDKSDSSDNGSSSGSPNYDPFADADDTDIDRAAKDISDKFNDKMQDKLTPAQRANRVNPFSVSPAKVFATSNQSVARGINASAGLRQSLNGLLQGMQHVRRTYKESGHKIEGRLLPTVFTGNSKVFKHKSKTVSLNSAFTILLDSSGSMDGSIVEAEAAVVSLLHALDNLTGVTTSAYHFPHSNGKSVGKLKDRKQTLRQAIAANHFGIGAKGSTPLSGALWPAIIDLAVEKADQRILIVCTDGDPDHGTEQDVIKMINDAKADGMVVIGIGFGSVNQSMMTRIFGNTGVAIGSLSNLRSKLFDVARRALLNR